MENVATAAFLSRDKKLPHVAMAIRKLNTLLLMTMILWETKSLRDKKYLALSVQLNDIGKMLGGWQGQLVKQNSSVREEK